MMAHAARHVHHQSAHRVAQDRGDVLGPAPGYRDAFVEGPVLTAGALVDLVRAQIRKEHTG